MKTMIILAWMLGASEPPVKEYAWFAQPSPKRDTLYLVTGDPLSKITIDIWKDRSQGIARKPYIVMVSKSRMSELKKSHK